VTTTKIAPTFSVADKTPRFSGQRTLLPAGRGQGNPGPAENAGRPDSAVTGELNLATRRSSEVQILDLDTDNPLVSYDGQYYSCQWASNIGTEMLFIAREKENRLPILRELPDRVDLLAASSARIISKHVDLKPKSQIVKRKRARFEDEDEDDGDDQPYTGKLLVKIGPQVSTARREQAEFLSQMIQLKEDMGEEDMVTVNVKKRLSAEKWKYEYWRLRKEERARLNQVVKKRQSGEELARAKARLEEMDKEDAEDTLEDPATMGPIPDRGRGSRGGVSHLRAMGAKKKGPGSRRPGRPAKKQAGNSTRKESEDMSTPGALSDHISYGTPTGFDETMDGTPIDWGTPLPFDGDGDGDGDFQMQDERFENAGEGLDYVEESPSQQLLNDMELYDEDAEGEDENGME
jgi:hypothetical protein